MPQPLEMSIEKGRFVIDGETVILTDDASKPVGEYLAAALEPALGYRLAVVDATGSASSHRRAGTICLCVNPDGNSADKKLGPEGYRLAVDKNSVRITGGSAAGVFYGCQTLRQLLPHDVLAPQAVADIKWDVVWSVPCARILDRPRFVWRGVLLDVARHFQDVEAVKKFIDELAFYKINRMQMHLTDDQGWRVEIKKYPKLTEVGAWRKGKDGKPYGGFYTQDQIRELVAYAAERFITIVPEFEMPGHASAAVASYPHLSCRGVPIEVQTKWGIFPDLYCAGNDATFAFIEDVLAEVVELFPSKYIHIGGDEAKKTFWKKCPKCQTRIKAEGLEDEHELQSYFVKRAERFLNSKGRVLIGWDEILEGGLAPRATVMSWRGVKGGIAAARARHDVVMSPTSHCYFDYKQYLPDNPPPRPGYISLQQVYSYEPIPPELDAAEARHILGAQANVWTERIPTLADVERMTFPRLLALAEVVWSTKSAKNWQDFSQRLPQQKRKLKSMGVEYFEVPKP
ncbi:MAG: beta-N-acetylhexosaminidase [Planctomycetota bacterium]|nr:beta-N-acetylhexosaminidase [Planctomycetota bacterium]